MKAIYGKHVRELFDQAMGQHFPEYRPFALRLSKEQRKDATLFPGSRIYRRVVSDRLHLFIHLIPHRKQERFMLEVGWSTRGRFPHELSSMTTFLKADRSELDQDEFLAGFNELYHQKHGVALLGWNVWDCSVAMPALDMSRANDPRYKEDYERRIRAWTDVFVKEDARPVSEDEASDRAQKAVLKCIGDIKAVAVPYLDELIRRQEPRPA